VIVQADDAFAGNSVRNGRIDELHRLSMTILMTPDMSNSAGDVHGGTLLKY
jgi:acyl-CoA hydrolase